MKKGQEFDEGVPRTPDRRSRLELIESASPIAFAEHPHFLNMQSLFQIGTFVGPLFWIQDQVFALKGLTVLLSASRKQISGSNLAAKSLSLWIVSLTVRILEIPRARYAIQAVLW
jgi:hypothetical protein